MRRFSKDTSATVTIETLITLPILIIFTFLVVQAGLAAWVTASMHYVSRSISREISVGELDDETNGTMTACAALAGVSADGHKSAEQVACDLITTIPGTYFIRASDGTEDAKAAAGAAVSVRLEVDTGSIIVVDPFSVTNTSGRIGATASHVVE